MGLRGFLDTNMLLCPMQNGGVGGLKQHDGPTQVVSHCTARALGNLFKHLILDYMKYQIRTN